MAHKVRWMKALLIVVAIAVGGGGGALVYPPPIVYGVRHHLLYVPNSGSNSITVYAATATGNVAPLRTIIGASTLLNSPRGVALDVDGTLYVTNLFSNSITVYAPGVTGNVAPIRIISGMNTGLNAPIGVDLDAAGNLYVANFPSAGTFPSITVYAPDATDNVLPIRTISGASTGLFFPTGVAVDVDGTLYVANATPSIIRINVYLPGVSGNVSPSRIIVTPAIPAALPTPNGVALDAASNLYLSSFGSSSIFVFGPGAGCAPPGCDVIPLRTISGTSTGLNPIGVDLDRAGNLYVANLSGGLILASITVYAPGATGNVAPIRTISGASTGLSAPLLISLR